MCSECTMIAILIKWDYLQASKKLTMQVFMNISAMFSRIGDVVRSANKPIWYKVLDK